MKIRMSCTTMLSKFWITVIYLIKEKFMMETPAAFHVIYYL